MGERKGTKGLELWCRRLTEGYPGVNVTNMTTSWRDGLAFCAIIHHFRPDLIEFSKLNKDDIYHNNELAFRIAERHLGIPALLEPEDMVEFPVPDRLSILTYLSQFYQTFAVGQGKSPARIAPKRAATSPDHGIVSPASTSPPTKVTPGKIRREPCAKCSLPVFIAERLNVGKLLYHRTCFRCARCNSQLTLANYYETENNEYCCETCPDEEKPRVAEDTSSVLTRSLSDEEKSASLKKPDELTEDDYSAKFETALEDPEDESLRKNSTLTGSSQYSKARSFFMTAQVEDESSSSDSGNEDLEDKPPDLPKSKPPAIDKSEAVSESDSGFPKNKQETPVNSNNSSNNNDFISSSNKSNISVVKSHDVVTKDTISAEGDSSSLVKARMRLFEAKSDASNEKVPSENEVSLSFKERSSFKDDISTEDTENETIFEITEEKLPEAQEASIIIVSDDSENVIVIEDSVEEVKPVKDEEDYPDDLNPFGDNEEVEDKGVSLNPFEEDDDEVQVTPSPKPAARRKLLPSSDDKVTQSQIYTERISVNPFEDDEESKEIPPQPAKRKIVEAPRISLNPFWSDDEENEDRHPIPKPRISKTSLEPKPRESGLSIASSATFGSSTSLASTQSAGAQKKKKPAPKPPSMLSGVDSGPGSLTSSPCHSVTHSPRSTPKIRKAKKAPQPPTSTPLDNQKSPPHIDLTLGEDFEKEKLVKDEQNRTKQQSNMNHVQSPSSSENSSSVSLPNKSTYGKWKRRKGQAPPRPIPQKRTIKLLPMAEVRRELEVIEIQQQGLEKQGVRLEQIIREKCEGPDVNQDESLSPEVEDMVLQLFELVNEKNELFRRQAELMYLRRQQRLEEEHADVEYQIRCLMLQPEANKTDSDKAREEELINRLVEIVERKNEIVECLEMDRVREAEEDDSINNQLNLYTLKKSSEHNKKEAKKEKKKHKKEKKFKLKTLKVDADKDIDESETSTSSVKVKDKKKKKFNIF